MLRPAPADYPHEGTPFTPTTRYVLRLDRAGHAEAAREIEATRKAKERRARWAA